MFNEMLNYIGDILEDDNSEDEDYYSDYDIETARFVDEIKSALERFGEMNN